MQNLTIYDISKLSGVSITTVSRVINGSGNVSQETRSQVEEVIRKHGYIPRQKSRNFARKNAFAVGLMLDDIRHPYMSELAHAINQELEKWKVNMILCNISDVEREFINKVDNLVERQVDGIILIGSFFEKDICKVSIERRYTELPFVAVNANFSLPNVWEVLQDQTQGVRDAVNYIYQLGRRNIGWICCHKSHSDQKKQAGFLEGMQKCGLSPDKILKVEEDTLAAGKAATESLLRQHPQIDAILYSHDILAVGGAHCLHESNIAIPGRIALVGINNSSCARECYPPLTSIDNRIADTGRTAAQIMVDIFNKHKQTADIIQLTCSLAVRDSTEVQAKNEDQDKGGIGTQQ